MKSEIEKLISEFPKHFVFKIKKDENLLKWVLNHSAECGEDSPMGERIYVALSGDHPYCENGNRRKFKSLRDGYSFCGRAGNCKCCRDHISKECRDSMLGKSETAKNESNMKRKATTLLKYGVENVGQLDSVREAHKEFYNNPENIQTQIMKYRLSMIEKYGVDNPTNDPEIYTKRVNTLMDRYGIDNPMKNIDFSEKSMKTRRAQIENGSLLKYGYEKVKTYLLEKSNMEILTLLSDYEGVQSKQKHKLRCITCGEIYEYKIDYSNIPICRICHPVVPLYRSKAEDEIYDFLQSNGITAHQSNRTLINPYELDIVCPDQKIAIEYNGLYWHSEKHGNKKHNYHQEKMKMVEEKGYRLISIFSDEWETKKEIVKNVLRHIFGIDDKRIYARKCNIVAIGSNEALNFYNNHHLMGGTVSYPVNLALIYNGQIVSVMSFSSLRRSLYKTIDDKTSWELTRFAASNTVVGGASRLMTYFVRNFNPSNIVSYADARWSQGNVYKQLGFNNEGLSTPRYWYTDTFISRQHRFSFRKDRLIKNGANPLLSEWEIMQSIGYDRVWDCGRYRFVWENI